MEVRRITFEEDGYSIDCWPAIAEINPLYSAAAQAFLRPHALGAQMGRLSEGRSEELLSQVYAEGVIAGSPSPRFDSYYPRDWRKWLLENREQFRILRSICEVRRNFEDPDKIETQGGADAANRGDGATP